MKKADEEMLEAIEGLNAAGAEVNQTKPVKPIRSPKKKVAVEDPTAGVATFAEDEGPFVTPPEPELIKDDVDEALAACIGGLDKREEDGQVAGEAPEAYVPDDADNESVATMVMKIRQFAHETNSIYRENPGTPSERYYPTQALWNYILALNFCHVQVVKIWEEVSGNMEGVHRDVYCEALLIDDMDGRPISRTIAVVSDTEEFIKKSTNPLSTMYGLAQTRAEARLARMRFGYLATLARLAPTPADELDTPTKWWVKQNSDKEAI